MDTDARGRAAFLVLLVLTVGQLALATLAPDLDQFEGKAFGARLVAYPVMMCLAPLLWWTATRGRTGAGPLPWTAFAFVAAPFLIDVTGNTLDLYDSIVWWDDANHYVNWVLLCLGVGLMVLRARPTPAWLVPLAVAGVGALLAIGWELGEWYTFIRHGTELETAYTDTLGDEAFGTLGGVTAGLILWWRGRTGELRSSDTR